MSAVRRFLTQSPYVAARGTDEGATATSLGQPLGRRQWLLAASSAALAGCVSVGVGNEGAPHAHHRLTDASPPPSRLPAPIVPALLIQPMPADAITDTVSFAYARAPNEYAFYQFASWTERPVRQLPRLLQRRLEVRGIAGAIGLIGEPMRADWLLALGVDTLHHDVTTPPGVGRVGLTVELFDRRQRQRVARRTIDTQADASRADATAAAIALSQAVGRAFDTLLPWLEGELQRAATAR